MERFSEIIANIDSIVWGPAMLIFLLGTSIYLTIRTRFLPWRNLPYALKSTFSKESLTTNGGAGDVSPFSALTTALAATIGTGNIVGVATAMIAGGPGALVWMWVSACFGLTSKFSECMLAIKYREINSNGEMSGGPMYTMKKAFRHKKFGSLLGWLFSLFAVIASFGVGNMTQSNSISSAIHDTFDISPRISGIVITLLAFLIIVGGIQTISKVSSILVPFMTVFYMAAGILVIILNFEHLPEGVALIIRSAFNLRSVSGGMLGTVVASFSSAMRYGVARGVFSNEAGMGSAAITAAAASTNSPVQQGYVNMTGTFWDTIVVCTITGLCIASSGVLGTTEVTQDNTYSCTSDLLMLTAVTDKNESITTGYSIQQTDDQIILTSSDGKTIYQLTACSEQEAAKTNIADYPYTPASFTNSGISGTWTDQNHNVFKFYENGTYCYEELYTGAALTIQAFSSVLGKAGGWMVTIGITLFAFSTILGWEYHGEKAFEYLLHSHKFNIVYRILFSLVVYIGATTTLDLVWNLSDIANALMAIPNLICLLALSNEIRSDILAFQSVLHDKK